MIEVTGLTKRYGEHVAVNDVSFAVEPGLVTGFLGPNGAGKSTTLRMMCGLLITSEWVSGPGWSAVDRSQHRPAAAHRD